MTPLSDFLCFDAVACRVGICELIAMPTASGKVVAEDHHIKREEPLHGVRRLVTECIAGDVQAVADPVVMERLTATGQDQDAAAACFASLQRRRSPITSNDASGNAGAPSLPRFHDCARASRPCLKIVTCRVIGAEMVTQFGVEMVMR